MNDLVTYTEQRIREIPEPTRSLLWISNDAPPQIISPLVDYGSQGEELASEPSMIWTRLEIVPNNELETQPMYWPVYARFSPAVRFQYLNWLTDITRPTNLSFVFLYFYGLERHLLVGDYDKAVAEILRLLKYHNKGSFTAYATRSLIVASIIKKRPDIIERAPQIMQEEIDEALALRIMAGSPISADDVISIASRVGFKNKLYIKKFPNLFRQKLQNNIDLFEKENGSLLSQFRLVNFREAPSNAFANLSITSKIRSIPVPQILENAKFKTTMCKLLQLTHDEVKKEAKGLTADIHELPGIATEKPTATPEVTVVEAKVRQQAPDSPVVEAESTQTTVRPAESSKNRALPFIIIIGIILLLCMLCSSCSFLAQLGRS